MRGFVCLFLETQVWWDQGAEERVCFPGGVLILVCRDYLGGSGQLCRGDSGVGMGAGAPPPLISGEAPLFLASKIFFKPLPKGVLCWEIEFCILKKLEPPPIRKRLPTPLGEDHIQPSIRILLLLKAKPPSVTAAFFWKSQQLLLCFEAKWSL